jgi:RNA:NAD 2'-phosphotransferase (TPT1/KptA family)
MANEKSQLADDADRATKLLTGKTISLIWRHRANEVGIEFSDGTRLFINASEALDLSITTGKEKEKGVSKPTV